MRHTFACPFDFLDPRVGARGIARVRDPAL